MIKAHQIRLNPTPEQAMYFRKAAGTKRFVYNWALDRWKWAKSQGMALYGMRAAKLDFNAVKGEQFPWVYDVAKDIGACKAISIQRLPNKIMRRGGCKPPRVWLAANGRLQAAPTGYFILCNGLGTLLRQIEYKSIEYGGTTVRVGRFYASSKTCSDCAHTNRELTLTDHKWTCQGCGTIHNRDWNAAKNIEQEALRLVSAG